MVANFGVVSSASVAASRSIKVKSTTILAIAGTGTAEGLKYHSTVEQAILEATDGTIKSALLDLDTQGVELPLVISTAAEGADEAETKTAVIAAVQEIKNAPSRFGVSPDLVIAPEFSGDANIDLAMVATADAVRGIALIDLSASDETIAINGKIAGRRAVSLYPAVQAWDGVTSALVDRPYSIFYAGVIAKTDAARIYGFAYSPSNQLLSGASGMVPDVGFTGGESCEADRLRTAGINTIINYNGLRTWGSETGDIDPVWQDLRRVRIFDRLVDAALSGLFWAVDRNAVDVLPHIKTSLQELLNGMKGAGVLLGFNVYWDPDKNTKTALAEGRFFLTVETQDTPAVKRLEVNFNYTDQYSGVLIQEV